MPQVDPLWLAGLGAAGFAWQAARHALKPVPQGSAYRPGDVDWVQAVRAELGPACRSLRLPGGTPARPLVPVWHGPGERVPAGWRFPFSTPGDVTVSELTKRADNLAAAINERVPLVAALEVDYGEAEGWGTVTVFRADPLERDVTIPWAPGARCPHARPGVGCFGVRRDGRHMHADIIGKAGAMCSMYAGMRGSGKSVGMLGQIAQLVAWGWCRPVLVDVVRNGVDLAPFEPLAGPVATTIKDARTAIKDAAAECSSRLPWMRERDVKCLRSFTPRVPLVALVVDEVHAVMADKQAGAALTRFAQESRAMGGLVIAATQYPTAEAIDSTFRMQFAHKSVYRVHNAQESATILGVASPDGQGPHELRAGPGACVADLDGSGLVTMRSWWLPDDWLRDHVEACAG